ncbi:hypothetical protein U1Q18_052515 [Sarracenia purpurea var. burkii]
MFFFSVLLFFSFFPLFEFMIVPKKKKKKQTKNGICENYKLASDVHHQVLDFHEGDYVIVHIHPECYPKNSFKKLNAQTTGPYRIIRKLGPNAYLLDLPSYVNISSIFNIEDLLPYQGTFEPPTLSADLY